MIQFHKKAPCENCPYRKDAPVQYWAKEEFADLLITENSILGKVYGCHKKDDSVCIGWLMNQDKRRFPSNMLRITLSQQKIDREYLDSLTCKSEQYETVEEMIEANYPELLK